MDCMDDAHACIIYNQQIYNIIMIAMDIAIINFNLQQTQMIFTERKTDVTQLIYKAVIINCSRCDN